MFKKIKGEAQMSLPSCVCDNKYIYVEFTIKTVLWSNFDQWTTSCYSYDLLTFLYF